ncbi:MAG: P1 family peptidase [Pseudomonadota bacterium]
MTSEFIPGPRNAITDVPGILVGQAEDEGLQTGVTVLTCPDSVAGAVDVRGGGPGTRETEVLNPENLVRKAHAIVLTGGSVFGLAAADAVTWALSNKDVGLKLTPGARALPIVPCAVLHDLSLGTDKAWGAAPPYASLANEAVEAVTDRVQQGAVGAGIGARAGIERGGIGTASLVLPGSLTAGALIASNPVGSVRLGDDGCFLAWAHEIGDEFGGRRPGPEASVPEIPDFRKITGYASGNTTIGVVATNATLTASECKRLAIMAQDGIARAVSPAHTHFDGDTLFAVSTGTADIGDSNRAFIVAQIGAVLADCVARAIAKGVFHAEERR